MTDRRRDLSGYRAHPPHPNWPNGARIAVNFCINYEEGGERTVLNGDDGSEDRVSDLIVSRKIGRRDLNMESCYEFGSRVGYWRLLRAFTDRGLLATVNVVGRAAELAPEALEAMINAGFDLAPHGWRWIDYDTVPEEIERDHIARQIEQIERLTGEKPLSYYAGLPSPNTRKIVAEHENFLYDSDCYNDDLPYWDTQFGRPLLLVPYSLDTNDSRFARGEGYETGGQFFQYIRDAFDVLYAEGETHPKMLTVGLHARLIGRPARIGSLYSILDHMLAHDKVWICRRNDLARQFAAEHPAPTL